MSEDEAMTVEIPIDEIEEEFAPQPKGKLGKATVLLAVLLVAGLGFIGGVEVQKHHTNSTSGAFGGRTGAAARAAAGAGFAAGTGGFGGRTGGLTGGGAGTGAATGAGQSPATPTVIGTIASISGNTMIVQNFGGKSITVKLTATTAVTKTVASSALTKGQTVTVTGATGSDGTVTATAVGAK
jgi:hypothetical protein